MARQEKALSEQRTLSGKLERTLELRADDTNRAARAEQNAAEATAAYHSVAKGWIDWAQAGLERKLPQPPAPRGDLAITWTRQIQAQRPMVTSALDEYQEVSQLREALQRAEREMLQLNKEREEARGDLLARDEGAAGDDIITRAASDRPSKKVLAGAHAVLARIGMNGALRLRD